MKEIFDKAKEVVAKTGKFLKNSYFSSVEVFHKGTIDLVTTADLKAEEMLKEGLKKLDPAIEFIAEESFSPEQVDKKELYWVIDPLDGTTNFAHKLPWFAISIALIDLFISELNSSTAGFIFLL